MPAVCPKVRAMGPRLLLTWAALLLYVQLADTISPKKTKSCEKDDHALAKWTSLRYAVITVITLYRVNLIYKKPNVYSEEPYGHKEFAQKISDGKEKNAANAVAAFFISGCLFVLTEGMGLAIYFSASAAMDNFTIFFIKDESFCKTTSAVALYTMALVTFLPNVMLGFYLQPILFNGKSGTPNGLLSQFGFVIITVVITFCSFIVRLEAVYKTQYIEAVDSVLGSIGCSLLVAIIVPPMVDAIQAAMLVTAGIHQKHTAAREPLAEKENYKLMAF